MQVRNYRDCKTDCFRIAGLLLERIFEDKVNNRNLQYENTDLAKSIR